MRISVGSVALLAPSTDARKASNVAVQALLLCAAASAATELALQPCQHSVMADTAVPTPLRAFALTCGTKRRSVISNKLPLNSRHGRVNCWLRQQW